MSVIQSISNLVLVIYGEHFRSKTSSMWDIQHQGRPMTPHTSAFLAGPVHIRCLLTSCLLRNCHSHKYHLKKLGLRRHWQKKCCTDAKTVYLVYFRKDQNLLSPVNCWYLLLNQVRRESKDHATLSDIYLNNVIMRFMQISEDSTRLLKKVRVENTKYVHTKAKYDCQETPKDN